MFILTHHSVQLQKRQTVMIFESLDFLDGLPLEAYSKHFGSSYKPRNSSRTFRSNMMLNPLQLKHLNRIDCSNADMITLNLEDAIAPSRKKEALYNIALFVSHMQSSNSFIIAMWCGARCSPNNFNGGANMLRSIDCLIVLGRRNSKSIVSSMSSLLIMSNWYINKLLIS